MWQRLMQWLRDRRDRRRDRRLRRRMSESINRDRRKMAPITLPTRRGKE